MMPRRCAGLVRGAVLGLVLAAGTGPGARSAALDQPYPFEGTWVRADRACTAQAPLARTYSSHDLSTSAGRCTLRRVVFGSGEYELFEDCRRTDRPGDVTERIRMLGPDLLMLKRQVNRLKIPRGRRYARCAAAAPKPAGRSFNLPPPAAPKP